MALALPIIQTIGAIVDKLPAGTRRLKVLSLAHPDLLMSVDQIPRVFPNHDPGKIQRRADSADVRKRHGLPESTGDLPDTRSLFDAIGCDITIVDVVEAGDVDRIVDLNEPLDAEYREAFDLVLDPGTVEHCFNIGQAIRNAATSVAADGFVLHANPMSMFYDFYSQNGFEIHLIAAMTGPAAARKFVDVPAVKRFRNAPPEARMVSVARRMDVREIGWPTQTKYGGKPG